jgi:uncharacterized membrane protein
MDFKETMDLITRILEGAGVAVILAGFLIGLGRALRDMLRGVRHGVYATVRKYFGQSILLGLEILVAADLIRTVAVEPTMDNVLVLGVIVVIRTLLSFSLEIEIYGRLPWRGSREAVDAQKTASSVAAAPPS